MNKDVSVSKNEGAPKRCPQCKGSKKILSIGMLLKECHRCHGIGFIIDKTEEEKKEIVENFKKRREKIKASHTS